MNGDLRDNIHISPMDADNVTDASRIERECFSEPWSLKSLKGELENPLAVYYTAHVGGDMAGFAGMHNVEGCGYITNIAVSETYRRRGAASALLRALIGHCRGCGNEMVTLEVRESNAAAIALYGGFGFEVEGKRRGYYRYPSEDALIMTLRL